MQGLFYLFLGRAETYTQRPFRNSNKLRSVNEASWPFCSSVAWKVTGKDGTYYRLVDLVKGEGSMDRDSVLHEAVLAVKAALDDAGIDIPFPIRTLDAADSLRTALADASAARRSSVGRP